LFLQWERNMPNQFGSAGHTQEKLKKLEEYLQVFTTVLKNQPFRLVYFDAFAGTPDIDVGDAGSPLLGTGDQRQFVEGSSRRALRFGEKFSRYIFVDKKRENVRELEALRNEHPQISDRIEVRNSDANTELKSFCSNWPRNQRAIVFLDPYGNQVAWDTVEAIASTRAIDLWYLFPAGLGVHRQIGGDGSFEGRAKSLDRLLGTPDWRSAFISRTQTDGLFGAMDNASVASPVAITEFMISRMKGVFKGGVLDEWLPLGSNGRHSYSLIFACANPEPKAHQLALRLAKAVLKR
jgi:three-Cys-motif partner protein